MTVYYRWDLRGESCPLCLQMAGRIQDYDAWSMSVHPGSIHANCNCSLTPVDGNGNSGDSVSDSAAPQDNGQGIYGAPVINSAGMVVSAPPGSAAAGDIGLPVTAYNPTPEPEVVYYPAAGTGGLAQM